VELLLCLVALTWVGQRLTAAVQGVDASLCSLGCTQDKDLVHFYMVVELLCAVELALISTQSKRQSNMV
jgi:hypothetical protein